MCRWYKRTSVKDLEEKKQPKVTALSLMLLHIFAHDDHSWSLAWFAI